MKVYSNYPLKELTTMKVGGSAKFFVRVKNIEGLKQANLYAKDNKLDLFILGGGSNSIISDNGFDGLVIFIDIKGFKILKEDNQDILIKVGAGEIWDEVVKKMVDRQWCGAENLSYIPGSVGATVVQNIGAYGVEIKDIVEWVEVYNVNKNKVEILQKKECRFKYRQSVFNGSAKGKYIILNVIFRLSKKLKANLTYKSLADYMENKNIKEITANKIRTAVINIRKDKLPDPNSIGSAGSFFKNLILDEDSYMLLFKNLMNNFGEDRVKQVQKLKERFFDHGSIKIPAAWLIDICGLKGMKVGGAYVYDKQPLIIINKTGQATASDILNLFKKIRQVVYVKTGMELFPEAGFVGFDKKELDKYFML